MNPLKVLIVDDQENWRQVIGGLLQDLGCTVKSAASADIAWHLLETESFDVAILDVRLVDSNPYDVQGIELVDQIRTHLGGMYPIIIMTGYSFEDMESILKTRYGVGYFINKGSGFFEDVDAVTTLVRSLLSDRGDPG